MRFCRDQDTMSDDDKDKAPKGPGAGKDSKAGGKHGTRQGDRPHRPGKAERTGARPGPGGGERPRPASGKPRSEGFGKGKPFAGRRDGVRDGSGPRVRSADGPSRGRSDRPQGQRDRPEGAERGRGRPFAAGTPDRGQRPERGGNRGQPRRFGDRQQAERAEPVVERARLAPKRDKRDAPKTERRTYGANTPADSVEAGERIAKRLARAGIASRRDAETLIASGRVRVNGAILASPAVNVRPDDRIEIDGQPLPPTERTRLFLFHKPAGVVTTNRDPEGRKTVFEVLPAGLPRLVTVGRLDINTEGLMLLTNDGGLARILELPSTGWLRRYRARVHGAVDEARLASLKDGIAIEGVFYGSVEAELERVQGSNAWLSIGIREGKNREVKAILGALGLDVNRLIRVSFGPFQLGDLAEGHVLEVKGRTLREQLGERLIEEAGANFEAEIAQPFSNRPVARGHEPLPAKPVRTVAREREGGLIKARDRAREVASQRPERRGKPRDREEILDKLQTSPRKPREDGRPAAPAGRPARSFEKRADRGERRDEAPARPRTSNVWMAPGARPANEKRPKAAEKPGKPPARAPRGEKPNAGDRSGKPDQPGPRRPGKGRDADRRR